MGTDDFRANPTFQAFILRAQRVPIKAGATLIHEGDASQNLLLVLEGTLTVSTVDEEGREMVLAWLGPGEFCGEMGLFPDQSMRSAAVRARSDGWVARMDYGGVKRLASEQPELVFRIAGQLAERLRVSNRRMFSLGYLDVTGRIARILLDLADGDGAVDVIDGREYVLTRQELSRMAACSREVAGRVLKTLEDEGMIRCQGRRLTVLHQS
ncbi:MAG: cyclic nucleotide-binding domain-containing protein [Oceanococcaceae bacterium]